MHATYRRSLSPVLALDIPQGEGTASVQLLLEFTAEISTPITWIHEVEYVFLTFYQDKEARADYHVDCDLDWARPPRDYSNHVFFCQRYAAPKTGT